MGHHEIPVLETKRLMATAAKVVGKLKMQQAATAFFGWLDSTQDAKKMRHLATKGMAKLLNRELTAAFTAWLEFSTTRRTHRVALARCVTKMVMRQCAAAYDAWRDSTAQTARIKHLATKVCTLMHHSISLSRTALYLEGWTGRWSGKSATEPSRTPLRRGCYSPPSEREWHTC